MTPAEHLARRVAEAAHEGSAAVITKTPNQDIVEGERLLAASRRTPCRPCARMQRSEGWRLVQRGRAEIEREPFGQAMPWRETTDA